MNTKNLLTRGFTLIELLVVIAIIGILAAVVIGSLNDARSGGQNASIQQTMTSLRSQAELYYNRSTANGGGNFSYRQDAANYACNDNALMTGITAALNVVNAPAYVDDATRLTAATNNIGNSALRKAQCVNNSSQYRITVPLAQGAGFWCVDSSGNAREVAEAPVAVAAADEATADLVCP